METACMVLRPLTTDDLDEMVAMCADPDVMRHLNGGEPVPRAVLAAELVTRPRLGAFAVRTGEFLGWFLLAPTEEEDGVLAELGYRLRRAVWGRGLATEGTRFLIGHAFTRLGAGRVMARTRPGNIASQRVMTRAGLRPVPTDDPVWSFRAELARAEWLTASGRA